MPCAPVPTSAEPSARVDSQASNEDEAWEGEENTSLSQRGRTELLREAAMLELETFISYLTYDGDDVTRLKEMVLQCPMVTKPMSATGPSRLVLHWDWCKEAESGLAWSRTHNPYERIPAMCKARLGFYKRFVESLAGGTAFSHKAPCPLLNVKV